ncbi:hypothetical protein J437_LFUL005396 [Ladona fulva]|uniref:ZP domain-containing protein n=1 Tax=Ladona fulva TaxID=123851 RepID=A0A8K0K3L5_LADFU|nr:hypothetical protein J437_LFUL005396 [Ladona fulva]
MGGKRCWRGCDRGEVVLFPPCIVEAGDGVVSDKGYCTEKRRLLFVCYSGRRVSKEFQKCVFCSVLFLLRWSGALGDAPLDSAALPLEHRGVYGPPLPLPPPAPPGPGYGPPAGADDPWPLATPDMPQIKHLQVQCEKTHMRVNIEFDRPFYGMIFSKGFYSDPHCVHLKPGSGHLSATFEIFLNSCGMTSSSNAHHIGAGGTALGSYGPTPSGSYVENTIIVQYDPYVQEVWDQARKLRCTWYDFYEKAVTFRPFQVDMLHAVTANFLGDNLQCWMQIQVGKGPWASEVSGIVKIGQTMTMVLAIKDDESKFDMLVRNCVAHDGKRAPIQLVDQHGCVVRPKIMSRFQKIKNFGPSASVVSFAYFQAFKFPDSMNVHFQCVIQVCRYHCPEPKCGGGLLGGEYGPPPPQHLPGPGLGEYGPPPLSLPAAYPDPRHPASGPAGAYSEPKGEVVPAPTNHQQSNQGKPGQGSGLSPPPPPQNGQQNNGQQQSGSSGDVQTSQNSPQNGPSQQSQSSQGVNLPPPPHPGRRAPYSTVKRKGVDGQEPGNPPSVGSNGNLATLGGRPRSVQVLQDLHGARRRRDTSEEPKVPLVPRVYRREAQEMTDVNTSRVIQVVAPGDVNFNLRNSNGGNDTTVVIQASGRTIDPDSICLSVASFTGGLVMLLLVLVVACLVAAFLFIRVRAIERKGSPELATTTFGHTGYDNSEFVKVAH